MTATNIWSWDYVGQILPDMLKALALTALVATLASLLALVLGLVAALLGQSRSRWVTYPVRFAIEFVRGTPSVVQLFFVFYVFAQYGLVIGAFVAGTATLGIHFAAYNAEVYRAGIASVPRGQWEAAVALGLSRRRTWTRVVLPLAIRQSVPALGNYVVGVYKETAVLFAIGVPVLLFQAKTLSGQSFRYLEPYTIAGALYLIVSYPSALLLRRLERKQ